MEKTVKGISNEQAGRREVESSSLIKREDQGEVMPRPRVRRPNVKDGWEREGKTEGRRRGP